MASGRIASRVLVVLALVTLVSLPLTAQTVTGTINGTIADRTGGTLPGVTVTIRNMETGLERTVVTNEAGFFNAPFLPTGRYVVSAELAGLGNARRDNVPVNLNQTTVQDFVIDPQVSETITVNAEAPRINVSDGEVKQTMREVEIMNIPQGNQTDFRGLAATFSGYQENPVGGQDNPTASSGSSVQFNGAGTRGTTFQINGVNNDDSSENQNRQGVALATIKSFQVLSNSFSSEFGRGYGAVVLVQTKSGTNDLSGEVYAYAQDGAWTARNILTSTAVGKPSNYRRQYGMTVGFPVMRDRLFLFANGDLVDNQGDQTVTRALLRPGVELANLPRLNLGNDTPENRAWQEMILARFPQNVQPNAPQIDSRAYQYPQFFDRPQTEYSARLDYNLSDTNNLTGRYQYNHQKFANNELIVGEATLQDNKQSNVGLTWTNTLSSNTVQEARYGLGIRDTNVNIVQGNDTPVVRFSGIANGAIIGNAGNFPINRDQRDQQFVYNISTARWTNHTLKAGTDIRRSRLDDRAQNFNRGFWNFTTSCGGVTYPNAYAAFWAGCVNRFQRAYGPDFLQNELTEENVYVQDDWRPWDNLVLNLGVRYERVAAPEEKEDRIDYFFGTNNYIDPRLGFAYTPNWEGNRFLRAMTGGNGRFSIRGGYGHYHGRVFQSIFSQGGANVRYNPPNAFFFDQSNRTNISDPTNGFQFVPGAPIVGQTALTLIDTELEMPETRQWNLTFERQVLAQSRIRVSYIATIGKNLLQYKFHNLPEKPGVAGSGSRWVYAADLACAGTGFVAGVNVNAACPNPVPIADNEVSLRVTRVAQRRPDPRFLTNLEVANFADSSYHAGQFEFETGQLAGFSGRMTYTFGKALDSGSEATNTGTGDLNIFPPDYPDYRRGLSRFDTRHRATVSGVYQFPFFRGRNDWVETAFGGWQLGTIIRLSSGTPFTIIDTGAIDIDLDGVANQRPICVKKEFCGGWHVNNPHNSQQEMPRDAFRRAVVGDDIADLMGRNTYFMDGSETVDLGLYKSFKLPGGSQSLLLRLDVFNALNHVTWGLPTTDFASASFGRITTTRYTPRTFQLGARFIY